MIDWQNTDKNVFNKKTLAEGKTKQNKNKTKADGSP